MLPTRLLIAEQVRDALMHLSPEDRVTALAIIEAIGNRPIDPDLGTYLSYAQRGVWVSYEVVGTEIWVTNCGRHPPGFM